MARGGAKGGGATLRPRLRAAGDGGREREGRRRRRSRVRGGSQRVGLAGDVDAGCAVERVEVADHGGGEDVGERVEAAVHNVGAEKRRGGGGTNRICGERLGPGARAR